MVTYKELRDKVQGLDKYEGCVEIERPPIINEGYPGQFNLSFTEHPWLVEHGRYLDFDHDYVFSTTPSCIRWNDVYNRKLRNSKLDSNEAWKYLGVFEMSDLIGMVGLKKRGRTENLHKRQISTLINLLGSLGIEKTKIYPSYQKGGGVSEVTKGKYCFEFSVPEDTLGKQIFLEQGIPKKNLIPDRTRDTLLAIRLERELPRRKGKTQIETPWGYRNEINVNIGTKKNPKHVDVGTIERFLWKPIYVEGKIEGLEDIGDEVSIGAVGLERLSMVENGLERVEDIDCIKPVYDALPLVEKRKLVGESLRALHRIYADVCKYGIEVTQSRKRKINRMKRNVVDSGLSSGDVWELLKINAESQPWHPELAEAVEGTTQEILTYVGRRIK